MAKISTVEQLRRCALDLPEVEEGTSCNKSAFRARKKAFLYLGVKEDSFNVMFKLGPSLAEAERLEKQSPDSFHVGSGAWVKVEFATGQRPPLSLLKSWVAESYRLLVAKQLVAELDGLANAGRPNAAAQRKSKKPAARKKVAAKKTEATKKKPTKPRATTKNRTTTKKRNATKKRAGASKKGRAD